MANARNHRSGGTRRGRDGSEGNEQGPEGNEQGSEGDGEDLFDVPEVHREIERRRFDGGLPATPELYARAREQWYRLPGAFVRPSMDPVVGDLAPDVQQPPSTSTSGEEERNDEP